ncbi:hypothetical protein [Ferruginivarius sediminum]|uniref:Uncharacterized protein n=1 Tax=Ferruginivarius sediminum TaxID=2661937 RepID=A0A369T6H3_9PROT|nr:hypothetical protein [Ferruginivarius sediminum]RDD60492.1 hypothetical protein DRB17_18000 [Ferruginivarius sediminum]
MEGTQFRIRFEGFEADEHALDMRHLGQSLVGLDRMISTGLIALSDRRPPRRGERFPLVVRAQEPVAGSVEIFGDLGPLVGALPLMQEVIATGASEIIWRWVSWVFLMAGGREKDADPQYTMLMQLTHSLAQYHERSEDKQRQFFLDILDRLHPAARSAVAPIGPSCDRATIPWVGDSEEATVVDAPMADAVRSKDKIEVGDMERMRVHVDGIIHHNRQLKVDNPEVPGAYLTAQVRDPAFDTVPNVYTDAASKKGWLIVDARPTYKAGALHGLYIMNAEAADDDGSGGSQ